MNQTVHRAAYGREEVRNGLFQKIAKDLSDAPELLTALSDEERTRSLNLFLDHRPADAHSVWVFAYGSLIWNPGFDYEVQAKAYVHGYHRKFCLKVYVGRGSRDHPGLLLGLDQGGSCHGLAYRLKEANLYEELTILWNREMMGGSYYPQWVRARLPDGTKIWTICFIIHKDSVRYHPCNNFEETVRLIANAEGRLGTCREYAVNTFHALQSQGINDKMLGAIVDQL